MQILKPVFLFLSSEYWEPEDSGNKNQITAPRAGMTPS
ncbi:hypothetical protein wTpre_991 [Wolbachia endosymbiont of Trichogramma pretiosum]|nr:hypothetical protein wTpre_991 [Wolbachia endosymbiont of Trichogramma pretiosum]